MRKLVQTLLVAVLLFGSGRAAQAQLWTAAAGGVAGTLSGGYISLSVVVTRAQFGHYLHEPKEFLGWTSLPVLIGGPTGAALGMWAPDRLGTGFVYGSAATLAGGTAGFVLGWLISNRPEGKWAGGAIGGGLGMAIGSTLGVLKPSKRFDPTGGNKTVVPITYTVHF